MLLEFAIWSGCLGFALGVFALPSPYQSTLSLVGALGCLAGICLVRGAESMAISLLGASALYAGVLGGLGLERKPLEAPWQNWFTTVLVAGMLWLLCLFVFWSVEQALILSEPVLGAGPAASRELLGILFDRYLWAAALIAGMGCCILMVLPNHLVREGTKP